MNLLLAMQVQPGFAWVHLCCDSICLMVFFQFAVLSLYSKNQNHEYLLISTDDVSDSIWNYNLFPLGQSKMILKITIVFGVYCTPGPSFFTPLRPSFPTLYLFVFWIFFLLNSLLGLIFFQFRLSVHRLVRLTGFLYIVWHGIFLAFLLTFASK